MRGTASWRYVIPDETSEVMIPGPQISNTGGIETVHGIEAVRQAIHLLLRTRPGERVMRPEYGCELHRLFFAVNDDTTAGLAMFYVRRALDRWEPRIEITRLDATRHPQQPELLLIELEYRLRATLRTDGVSLSVNLAGD
jgi:phage baseplate assembly protein W